MIYGNVNNAFFEQQAAVLPGPLKKALHVLKDMDLANHETGAFPMALDGVEMILQVMDLETSPREAHEPEIHRKYVDLQLLVSGGPEVHTFFPDGGKETVKDDRLGYAQGHPVLREPPGNREDRGPGRAGAWRLRHLFPLGHPRAGTVRRRRPEDLQEDRPEGTGGRMPVTRRDSVRRR